VSNDPEFPEIAYQGIEQDIAATARVLESHRAKWEDLAHKAWRQRDVAVNQWLEGEQKLSQCMARVEILRAQLLDRLLWIHRVDHAHRGVDLRHCRVDMCRRGLVVLDGDDPWEGTDE